MLSRLVLALAAAPIAAPAPAADFMFSAVVDGQTLEGRPLTWTDATMTLLARDGQLHYFAPGRARQAKRTSPTFRGYDTEQMRERLYEEFGSRFDFTSTGHYLVAHPRSERGVWAERFESMYRAFVRYFRVRGFDPVEPPYPLVAVVFGNRSEYQRYVEGSNSGAPTGALGHYEPRSNRVYLYDQSSAGGDDRWDETASTVVHEATHQTAYNVGVHTRFAEGPRWVSEGLATMFEARGVHDSLSYDRGESRINRGRLADYLHDVAPNQPLGTVATFISSDQAFERTPIPAYANAWALTFFLSETRPQQYAEYLALTAQRPLFSEYPPEERVADFRSVFGQDLELLDAQFVRYTQELR
ncbi:DUF1570 domain-containing protein [Botrimarina sp.]|uniref:DUF1570 domain-containing protein n=1 Tax=Botrimarina sp. TaxID=2795802 RepID=UPI0032EAA675